MFLWCIYDETYFPRQYFNFFEKRLRKHWLQKESSAYNRQVFTKSGAMPHTDFEMCLLCGKYSKRFSLIFKDSKSPWDLDFFHKTEEQGWAVVHPCIYLDYTSRHTFYGWNCCDSGSITTKLYWYIETTNFAVLLLYLQMVSFCFVCAFSLMQQPRRVWRMCLLSLSLSVCLLQPHAVLSECVCSKNVMY